MSAAEMLEQARALGIVLSGDGGTLCYEAPAGRLTPELRRTLSENKAAILALLGADLPTARRTVYCRDCIHHLPTRSIHRKSGAVWEMPGGCAQGRTSPDSKPPIYPFTGWYCDGWMSRSMS